MVDRAQLGSCHSGSHTATVTWWPGRALSEGSLTHVMAELGQLEQLGLLGCVSLTPSGPAWSPHMVPWELPGSLASYKVGQDSKGSGWVGGWMDGWIDRY